MVLLLIQILFAVPLLAVLWVIAREALRCWRQRRANRAELARLRLVPGADEFWSKGRSVVRGGGFGPKHRRGYDAAGHEFSHGREYVFGRSMVAEFPREGGGLRLVEMAVQGADVPECP